MEVPLGLTTSIVGIAVGYKTTILPRNLNHIKEYMAGHRKMLNHTLKYLLEKLPDTKICQILG